MNEQKQSNAPVSEDVAATARDIHEIGRAWAAHGLVIGKQALENAAEALRITADSLGRLASRVK
jgi:hypothetical protein